MNAISFPGDLFITPFLTGLCFALLLPLLGCLLRLRDEWLGALAYPHIAAAGALGGMALGVPASLGGLLSASLAAFSKGFRPMQRNTSYVLILLCGWAGSTLITANLPSAEQLGHALFDGQLYFADHEQAGLAALALALALPTLIFLSRTLLRERIFPQLFTQNEQQRLRINFAFDLLTATLLALATMSLGILACFSLVFLPAWAAFNRCDSWRRATRSATALGCLSYLLGFAGALHFDQPFGPSLAFMSLSVCAAFISFSQQRA